MSLEKVLRRTTEKEISRMGEVFSQIELEEKCKVFELALAYYNDAKYFLEKNMLIEAFEAITISWTYIDALLHMNKARIPSTLREYFTI